MTSTLSFLDDPRIKKLTELFSHQVWLDITIFILMLFQLIGQITLCQNLMHLKPIPVMLMIGKSIFISNSSSKITAGLIFSLTGDVLLMLDTLYFFEVGTFFFLLGHIFYISAFLGDFYFERPNTRFQKYFAVLMTGFIFVFLIVNNVVLWDILPDKVLFPMYTVVLSAMAATSLYRFKETRMKFYYSGVMGALLFMISDTIIGHTKLKQGSQTALDGTVIMLTYYLGQFLILKGNTKQQSKRAID